MWYHNQTAPTDVSFQYHRIPEMNFLRNHWYDMGAPFIAIILAWLGAAHAALTNYEVLMWLSLAALLCHQLEEYRVVGTFPGMLNRVMFKSETPDRYPLNTNSALAVNVVVGWSAYFMAALLGEHAVWLGLATIMVSLGNIVAHTFVFNIKGKTFYNAGLATSWLLFAPCVFCFFRIVTGQGLASPTDYLIGIALGVVFNVFGIFKLIRWMADKHSPYTFARRNLLPADRNAANKIEVDA